MEEDQYRKTYGEINQLKCVFEKAINSRQCACSQSQRFNLADREGVACQTPVRHEKCVQLLVLMRSNASFSLQMQKVEGPLPHAREIKVQVGGLQGLQVALGQDVESKAIMDIDGLIQKAESTFGQIENFPYPEIIKSISRYKGRQRRQSRK
ncbi:MAG: hypothetical protein OQK73_02090 [Gammaproteobacteria bacterium]|nr:hypothetical protein [Gammaproteobacteria bacterium]